MTDAPQPIRWQIYTGANPTVERIIPELAVEIGLNESIMLMQISYWIGQSKNVRDGVYWTYNSARKMHKNFFPYWSPSTIARTIKNLKDKGYIIVGNFNKHPKDKTQWFALEPDKLSTLQSVLIAPALMNLTGDLSQNDTGVSQNETTLPKTSTDIKKTLAPNGADGSKSKEPKARKPNPIFDAVALGSFGLTKLEGDDKTLGARIGKIVAWLNKQADITPERVTQFYAWYRRQNENAGAPRDPGKFAEWWMKFASNNDPVMDDETRSAGPSYVIGSADDPFKDEIID